MRESAPLPGFSASNHRHVVEIGLSVLAVQTDAAGRIGPLIVSERRDEKVIHEHLDRLSRLRHAYPIPRADWKRWRAASGKKALCSGIHRILLAQFPTVR